MSESDQDARERIMKAAADSLQERGVGGVTMRDVAARAGVGLGLINYHFGSKALLLRSVVERVIGSEIRGDWDGLANADIDPKSRLRAYFRARGRLVTRYPDLMAVVLENQLLNEPFDEAQRLVPLLREFQSDSARELNLHLVAFVLTAATNLALLRPQAFKRFSKINMDDRDQREMMLDTLIDILLPAEDPKSG